MKILLVEDDENIQRITKLVLEKSRHEVLKAMSGKDGLALARGELPDVILLDYNLPDRDGPSILIEILADDRISLIPVIFLTAIASRGEEATFKRMGARGLISKPFKPTVLMSEIERVLAS